MTAQAYLSPMPLANQEEGSPEPTARRMVLCSAVGTTLEYYDFFVYGPVAALVFAKVFFPAQAEGTALLLSLGTFAIGFVARPIGALLGGHVGDRAGRKIPMLASILVMGLATFLIGCLPGYQQIGLWAPALLLLLRFVQGIALGSEWSGAASLAVEHAPPYRRGLYGSAMHAAAPIGTILSSGVVALVTAKLTPAEVIDWGWRIPFLLSIVLVALGVYLRLQLIESPAFLRIQAARQQSLVPVVEVLRRHPKRVLAAIGLHLGDTANGYVLVIFGLGYATRTLGLSSSTVLMATIIGSLVALAAVPVVGRLCDRYGPTRTVTAGGVAMVAWGFPMFWMINSGSVSVVVTAFCIGLLITCLIASPLAVLYARLFEPRVRASGMAIGFQTGAVLGGGLSPVFAQALQNAAGGASWPVSLYLMGVGLLVLGCVAMVRSSLRTQDLPA